VSAFQSPGRRVLLGVLVLLALAVSACGGDAGASGSRPNANRNVQTFDDVRDDYTFTAEDYSDEILDYAEDFPELDFLNNRDLLDNVAWLCAEVDVTGVQTVTAVDRLAAKIGHRWPEDLDPLAEAAGSYVCPGVISDYYVVDPYGYRDYIVEEDPFFGDDGYYDDF